MTAMKKTAKKKMTKRTALKKKKKMIKATKKTALKKKKMIKATKKTVAKRKMTRKMAAKVKVSHAPRSMVSMKTPSGFVLTEGGLLVSRAMQKPVPASKMSAGLSKAKKETMQVISKFVSSLSGDYSISEIEFSVCFNADGKFLGFGVGGAASIKIKIKPI